MKMKSLIAIIISVIWSLVSIIPVQGDMAPPSTPPGSGINPSQETKVQMVAENVLMVIKETAPDVYNIEVTADFAMRNHGLTAEKMQVRFPLEDVSGLGDGWGYHPEVRDFRVRVNNVFVPSSVIQEPYQSDGVPLNWAVFDVNFPVDQDVFVHVSYLTDVQEYPSPSIHYVLGTGAGWYQSIGTATITLRFPYAASMANILSFGREIEMPENCILIGKEIRWHWENYEPDPDEIVAVTVVHPVQWQNILDLEAKTGFDPDDIGSVIDLSRKYQRAGSNKDYISTPLLADLAEIAVEQALALHPDDVRLHSELVEIYRVRYGMSQFTATINPYAQKLRDEIAIILVSDPGNQRALGIKAWLDEDLAESLILTPTPSPSPSATSIRITATKTITLAPTETFPLPTLPPAATPPAMVEKKTDLPFFTWAFLLFIGFVLGTIFSRGRPKGKDNIDKR